MEDDNIRVGDQIRQRLSRDMGPRSVVSRTRWMLNVERLKRGALF